MNELNLYLRIRCQTADDEDEKAVLDEIVSIVSKKLSQTDGLVDSEAIFTTRLDKLLFTAPNQRKKFIEANLGDMSPGFISHIQSEMKNSDDMDSKVVLASLLKLIGEAQNADYLGKVSTPFPRSQLPCLLLKHYVIMSVFLTDCSGIIFAGKGGCNSW